MLNDILSKINSFVVSDPENNRGFELRMSTAGDCVRKLEYDSQLGKPPVTIESAMRMGMGEPIHSMWRTLLAKVYPDDFEFAEDLITLDFEVNGERIVVPGHPDGSLRFLEAIVEVKGVSDSTFTLVKNAMRPLESHRWQGNAYAGALNKKGVLFVYQNRDSGEYLLLLEPFSEELLQATVAKWATVHRNKRAFEESIDASVSKGGFAVDIESHLKLTPRPYQDATGSPCFFCSWKVDCYKGFSDQVSKMAKTESDSPEIMRMGETYNLHRSKKLEHTKLEESVKTDIALWMIDNSFNLVKVPAGTMALKIGVNNNPIVSIKPTKE